MARITITAPAEKPGEVLIGEISHIESVMGIDFDWDKL